MKVVLQDGTKWEIAGVTEDVMKAYFGPFSKDGFSVTDVRMNVTGGVWIWNGPQGDLQAHIGEMAEAVMAGEEAVSMEERSVMAMELQAYSMYLIALELKRANELKAIVGGPLPWPTLSEWLRGIE